MKPIILAILFFVSGPIFAVKSIPAEEINPDLLKKFWDARWIAYPDDSGLEYGVYHFRKSFELEKVPQNFVIHVSADNRYRLFVNGTPVCFGPARGDLMHWNFESIDIAGYLKPGPNTIAAVVWNFAGLKPWAQISLRTAFILQGNSETEEVVNTGNTWKVTKNLAYSPADASRERTGGSFIVVGPCDAVNGELYPWGWEKTEFDDTGWKKPKLLEPGRVKTAGTGIEWGLQLRSIPLMEARKQQFTSVRIAENIKVSPIFLKGNEKLVIPADKKVKILFDQGELTTAYPEINISGGKNAAVELKYAEALFDSQGAKGNRNEVEGKQMRGYIDFFYPDGGENRLFRPLWLRTWRYLELTITTGNEPLIINSFESEFTGYPFVENAAFISSDSELEKIWQVGWHTARLCAGETYYDCPYYEQMQYVGDTRIQALISLYVSGDDRLMRHAIQMFDESRFSEGLTMSRYPSSMPQVIPPYSLFWIDMVYDYWMHRDDPEFVSSFLNGMENVLAFFINRIDKETGLLGYTGYWNFVDWPDDWPWNEAEQVGGVPEGGVEGKSAILSLQLAYSARHAAAIFNWNGNKTKADYYNKIADEIIKSVKLHCWDSDRKYFADSPVKKDYSMHTQIFAVLTGAVDQKEMKEFVLRFESDKSLIQPTMYFRFYLTQAMKTAGLADKYLETLDLWREMLKQGLTTFAERPDPTRSDCHAWSASPNYDFLATIAGIEPASPGFKTVKIEPHLGALKSVKGKVPHPTGDILVEFEKTNSGIKGYVSLPAGLTGQFVQGENVIRLKAGENTISVNPKE